MIPTGVKAKYNTQKFILLNQTQTTELDEIVQPFKQPNATELKNALRGLVGVG